MTGRVIKVIAQKGYGFIKSDSDREEYFFHRSGFDGHWEDLTFDIEAGKKVLVKFEVIPSDKGPRAESITRTDLAVNGVE